MTNVKTGQITYDDDFAGGHVCTCSRRLVRDKEGEGDYYTYENTVVADRSVEPTQSGSWWYYCTRCGAGAWSGA